MRLLVSLAFLFLLAGPLGAAERFARNVELLVDVEGVKVQAELGYDGDRVFIEYTSAAGGPAQRVTISDKQDRQQLLLMASRDQKGDSALISLRANGEVRGFTARLISNFDMSSFQLNMAEHLLAPPPEIPPQLSREREALLDRRILEALQKPTLSAEERERYNWDVAEVSKHHRLRDPYLTEGPPGMDPRLRGLEMLLGIEHMPEAAAHLSKPENLKIVFAALKSSDAKERAIGNRLRTSLKVAPSVWEKAEKLPLPYLTKFTCRDVAHEAADSESRH